MEERLQSFINDNRSIDARENYENMPKDSIPIIRFVHHQVIEMARDCLQKSQEKLVTSRYFYEMSENLERLLSEVLYVSIILEHTENLLAVFSFNNIFNCFILLLLTDKRKVTWSSSEANRCYKEVTFDYIKTSSTAWMPGVRSRRVLPLTWTSRRTG
jgi:Domain of unknown function (DUF1908).